MYTGGKANMALSVQQFCGGFFLSEFDFFKTRKKKKDTRTHHFFFLICSIVFDLSDYNQRQNVHRTPQNWKNREDDTRMQ